LIKNNTKILISPLHWGLGHAMRIVPISQQLHANGCTIFIAASSTLISLLKEECPYATFIDDNSVEIKYGATSISTTIKLLSQLPVLLKQIKQEQLLVKQWIKTYDINFIISDNRYGLYHAEVPSILITHQLNIQFVFGKKIIKKINERLIGKFFGCWVPDNADKNKRVGGILTENNSLKLKINYIGLLSRFGQIQAKNKEQINKQLLFILSGPEPQRTVFENKIIAEVTLHKIDGILVRGTQLINDKLDKSLFAACIDFANAALLKTLIENSNIIICRAGYSSIMDLICLQKKAMLVATPGQSEQVYLSKYVSSKKWFYSESQKHFSLQNVDRVNDFDPIKIETQPFDFYQLVLKTKQEFELTK
jgi:predicted glycosyltransferase